MRIVAQIILVSLLITFTYQVWTVEKKASVPTPDLHSKVK